MRRDWQGGAPGSADAPRSAEDYRGWRRNIYFFREDANMKAARKVNKGKRQTAVAKSKMKKNEKKRRMRNSKG